MCPQVAGRDRTEVYGLVGSPHAGCERLTWLRLDTRVEDIPLVEEGESHPTSSQRRLHFVQRAVARQSPQKNHLSLNGLPPHKGGSNPVRRRPRGVAKCRPRGMRRRTPSRRWGG